MFCMRGVVFKSFHYFISSLNKLLKFSEIFTKILIFYFSLWSKIFAITSLLAVISLFILKFLIKFLSQSSPPLIQPTGSKSNVLNHMRPVQPILSKIRFSYLTPDWWKNPKSRKNEDEKPRISWQKTIIRPEYLG